ncbi:hypothetical protein BV20DRAFT_967011 [Pilatotrama ljubarskyi]|nr:hypothetical protein BV20DRAFT_967011 [Pilatotrama ljubarskyi]
MSVYTRDLTFWSHDLGENVTLLLCFTPPTPDQTVAWKSGTLSAIGTSVLDVTYINQLGFCLPHIGGKPNSTYTPIKVGETTTLNLDTSIDPPVYSFTPPVLHAGAKDMQALNDTGRQVDMALGLISPGMDTERETITPVMIWRHVCNGICVSAQFTPVLRAYISRNYRASENIKGELLAAQLIWKANLADLGPKTKIQITKDASNDFVARSGSADLQE